MWCGRVSSHCQTAVPGADLEAVGSVVLMEKSGGTGLWCFAIFSCSCIAGLVWHANHSLLPYQPTDFQVSTLMCYKNQCIIGLIHSLKRRSPGEGTCCTHSAGIVSPPPGREKTNQSLSSQLEGNTPDGLPQKSFPRCVPDLNEASQSIKPKCWGKGNKWTVSCWERGLPWGGYWERRERELFWVLEELTHVTKVLKILSNWVYKLLGISHLSPLLYF